MHGPLSPSRRRAVAALLATVAALVTLGATACGPLFRRGAAGAPPMTITFVNQSQDLANVYAVGSSGEPFRIGNVPAGRTETLTLPRAVFSAGQMIHFLARPLATSRWVQSGSVSLSAGDRITVTLPAASNTLSILPSR
jgi:hypothetical protein